MHTNLLEDNSRYFELAAIQSQDLLTFEEQEEYIEISTKVLYRMMEEIYGNDL